VSEPTGTLDRIKRLAEQRAKAAHLVSCLMLLNTPTGYEERVAADARFKLAEDALDKADAKYREALSNVSASDLLLLAQST